MEVYKYNETILACRMCRHACTVGNVTQNDANIPRGKALLLFVEQMELLDWDDRAVDIVYECTNCHLCREWCVNGWDIASVMLAARADVVERGLEPQTAKIIMEKFKKSGNQYGEIKSRLKEWIGTIQLPEKADVLYFAGCTTAFRRPEIAKAAVAVMKKCGTDFTMLADEPCCGEPLYVLGYRSEAKVLAERTIDRILATGAKTVVSSSPTCVETFRHGYREWGVDVPDDMRFLHISEYLANEIGSGRLEMTRPLNINLTYHDPCSLGRELRIFDEPRSVLKAVSGIEFREMRLTHEHSLCCGNGGGVPATNFEIAYGAGKNAGEEVLETGADVLITACPSCKQSFRKHVGAMEVWDIAELVERAL